MWRVHTVLALWRPAVGDVPQCTPRATTCFNLNFRSRNDTAPASGARVARGCKQHTVGKPERALSKQRDVRVAI